MFKRWGYECPSNYNPADMIIEKLSIEPHREAACRERIDAICANFQESAEANEFFGKLGECQTRAGKYPEKRKTADFSVQVREA